MTATAPPRAAGRRVTPARTALLRIPPAVVVGILGLGARLAVVLRSGGLHGSFGYDAAVYFGAADALTRGRLPYRDFVLLHPPGLMLALTPFAALTRVTSDDNAFTVAVLAFAVLGAVNGVLVVRVAGRLGLGRTGSLVAGAFYALWFGAVGGEYLTKLEPLGNLLFLLAVLGVLRLGPTRGPAWTVLAGVPLGALVSVKIWWVVPVAGVLVWHAWRSRDVRSVGLLALGALAAAAVVDGPFLVAAPRAMWSAVVADQLGRHPNAVSPLGRLADLSTVPRLTGALPVAAQLPLAAAVLGAIALGARRAWSLPAARPAVLLLLAQLVVLLAAPSWFPFYADYLAVAAAIVVGAAGRPGRVTLAGVATVTAAALAAATVTVHPYAGRAALARAVAPVRCVMSDEPMVLIELDALSRGLAAGCSDWIDVTGRTYGPDRGPASRVHNLRWQRDLRAYLRSGGAVMIGRAGGTGLDAATWTAVRRDGVLARVGRHVVYRVRP